MGYSADKSGLEADRGSGRFGEHGASSEEAGLEMDRRRLMQLVGGGVAALFLPACKGTGEGKGSDKKPVRPEALPPSYTLDITTRPDIEVPTFRELPGEVVFPQPPGMEMPPEEFRKLCAKIVGQVVQLISTELPSELAQAPAEVRSMQARVFMSKLPPIIMGSSSEAAGAMDHYFRNNNPDKPVARLRQLNRFLNPGGLYLTYSVEEQGDLNYINYKAYKINESGHLAVGSIDGDKDIIVLSVGEELVGLDTITPEVLGSKSVTCDHLILHTPVINRNLQRFSRLRNFGSNLRSSSEARLKADFVAAVRNHEAVHALNSIQFPKMGKRYEDPDQLEQLRVVEEIKIGSVATDVISLGGLYHPASLDELCAAGAEIATAKDASFKCILGCLDPSALGAEYQLMNKVLAVALLLVAPDCPQKATIQAQFGSPSGWRAGDLRPYALLAQLVANPPFSAEHAKQVGEILYKVGYLLMEKMEKGE